jgi:hypothetical protein
VDTRGFVDAKATPRGRRLALTFERRADLPVRVDVFRVSKGRRVVRERLVARFENRTSSFTWNGRSSRGQGPGVYFARFTMLKDGKPFDRRRVVVARGKDGRFRARPEHFRRDSCSLLGKFKLVRPAFGGTTGTPLAGSYRSPGRVA